MLRDNRVLFKPAASAFQDFSQALSDIHAASKVMAFVVGDYLYLGSILPFNHRYFDLAVVNDQASSVSVDIWDGNSWQACVDIVDETKVGNNSLGQNGIISWQIDLDEQGWAFDDTNEMTGSGLETGPKIFKFYWARMKWSAALKVTTELKYVGHKFSEDPALQAEYPIMGRSSFMDGFKDGKVDWNEQTLMAAEYIVQDLRGRKGLLKSPDQILNWSIFEKASIHRVAMIAFKAFGSDYERELVDATNAYKQSMSLGEFDIDENANADLDEEEREPTVTYMER